jgi:hypothetical protein
MRVFISHRYFWPDRAPEAAIFRWVASHLVMHGYSVDVVSSQPSYHGSSDLDRRPTKEVVDGIRVTRLRLPPESGGKFWRISNAIYLGLYTIFKTFLTSYLKSISKVFLKKNWHTLFYQLFLTSFIFLKSNIL